MIHRTHTPRLIVVVILIAGLVLAACGGGADQSDETTEVPSTSTPAPTPLPPLPTVAALGSPENPLEVMLVVAEDGADDLDTSVLSEALSDVSTSFEVSVTTNYSDAFAALCTGDAQVVILNTFGTLAAEDEGCGIPLYILEMDGATFTQGQMISAVGRNVFTVEGFRGQTYCRTDANSVNTWIVPSLMMRSRRLDPFLDLAGVIDLDTDEDVVNGVFTRECSVGATTLGAHEGIPNPNPALSGRILVIEELPPVPNDAILVSATVSDGMQAFLIDAIDDQADVLAGLLGATDLIEVDGETYVILRDLFRDAGVDIASLSN